MIITRFHNLKTIELEVEFLTPTFLGGWNQNAELRSSPFKNLLRQWWRVTNDHFAASELLIREGNLFGSIIGDKSAVSRVRMSLVQKDNFSLADNIYDLKKCFHPEVTKRVNGQIVGNGTYIDNSLYLGYGPVTYSNGVINLRKHITVGSKLIWYITCPEPEFENLKKTLTLINCFGTIGGRCRNGYGSITLKPLNNTSLPEFVTPLHENLTSLVEHKEYPHAIGRDNKAILAWDIECSNWENGMAKLAETYIGVRTNFKFPNGIPYGVQKRHILGFPVTNHPVKEWNDIGKKDGRMPSQLRLMIKRRGDSQLVARILHLPHKLPKPWNKKHGTELSVWKDVHNFLDNQHAFRRMEVK